MGFNDFSSGVKLNNIKAYGNVNTAANDAFKKQVYSNIEEIDYGSYEEKPEEQEINLQVIKDNFNSFIEFLQLGNKKAKSKTDIWSSWYGGSAKHTKDHLHMYIFQQIFKTDKFGENRKDGSGFFKNIVDSVASQKINNNAIKSWNNSWQKKQDGKKILNGEYNSDYRVGQNWEYGSVKILNYGASVEDSVHNFWNVGGKDDFYESRADFLYANADCAASITPNGLILSASAEASVLHAEGRIKGNYDVDVLGLDADITVIGGGASASADLGHVYGSSKFAAGIYRDDKGKRHTELGLQAKIGADACSATVNAEGTLMGVGVGGTATVKVGIGAQANLGFVDGKFNCHVGLALGVGVELGFSIDVSDWTNTALEAAQKVGNDIITSAKNVGNWFCGLFT